LLLKGMVQSLQCFDDDSLLIVAGINRREAKVFRLNSTVNAVKSKKP